MVKSKEYGGMDIRDMRPMNNTLVGKMFWRLQSESDSLWAQCIIQKYMGGNVNWNPQPKKKASCNWTSVYRGAKVARMGILKEVNNGRSTYFWTDGWTSMGKLFNFSITDINHTELQPYVKSFWDEGDG